MDNPYPGHTRWMIAIMGTALQLCLGTVYAWSFFQNPLVEQYGWSHTQVSGAFSLAIAFLGLAAAWGGLVLPRLSPRRLAMSGGLLFGSGYLLAALALHIHSLPLLYAGYGVIGGLGLGLGYVTPVTTVARWFPDKKGLVTGMVIMGFGFGAILMSKIIAPQLLTACNGNLVVVFASIGIAFTIIPTLFGSFLRNPPDCVNPASSTNPLLSIDRRSIRSSILSGRFLILWLVFFCNILAGISIIGFQSPLFQDLWHRIDADIPAATLAGYGASLIAVSSLFNGIGRIFWGGLSDRIGRIRCFQAMLASQVIAFGLLIITRNPWIFGILICYILLCYGGGFGTMPSFVLDTFGPRLMPVVYGTILTAWSAGGLVGPQMVALLKDRYALQAAPYAFRISAGVLLAGLALAYRLSSQPFQSSSAQT